MLVATSWEEVPCCEPGAPMAPLGWSWSSLVAIGAGGWCGSVEDELVGAERGCGAAKEDSCEVRDGAAGLSILGARSYWMPVIWMSASWARRVGKILRLGRSEPMDGVLEVLLLSLCLVGRTSRWDVVAMLFGGKRYEHKVEGRVVARHEVTARGVAEGARTSLPQQQLMRKARSG